MPPTSIDTLALAVCVGSFQYTVPVFVTRVPTARFALSTARKRRMIVRPGCSAPYVVE